MRVPQGGAISPLLFNVFTADIPRVEGVMRTEYADDIAFIVREKTVEECLERMQGAMDTFYGYIQENKMEINYQKTYSMMFTKQRVAMLPLTINDHQIEDVNSHKYLGIILDAPWLTCNKHIEYLVNKCRKRTNILIAIANKDWGVDREMLSRIYKALILIKINYGAEIYGTAGDTMLKKIEAIQNMALRIIAGARNTSPIVSLQVESDFWPLKIERNKQLLWYYNIFLLCLNH